METRVAPKFKRVSNHIIISQYMMENEEIKKKSKYMMENEEI